MVDSASIWYCCFSFCFFNLISYGFSGAGIDTDGYHLLSFSFLFFRRLCFSLFLSMSMFCLSYGMEYTWGSTGILCARSSRHCSRLLFSVSLRCTSFGYIFWVDWAGGRWNQAYIYIYIYWVRAFASSGFCLAGIALAFPLLLDTLNFTALFVPCLFVSRCIDVM
jgi:hypothetical protein